MESIAAIPTVFAILIQNLQFDFTYGEAFAVVVICAGAWILIAVDMRRSSRPRPARASSTSAALEREFADVIRRRGGRLQTWRSEAEFTESVDR